MPVPMASDFDTPPGTELRPAELTDRYPVMAEAFRGKRIAGALQGEHNGIDAASGQGLRDREWHHAAACDQSNRRRNC